VDRHVEGVGEESFQPIVALGEPRRELVEGFAAVPAEVAVEVSAHPVGERDPVFPAGGREAPPRKRSYIDASVESGRSRAAIRRRSSTALSSSSRESTPLTVTGLSPVSAAYSPSIAWRSRFAYTDLWCWVTHMYSAIRPSR